MTMHQCGNCSVSLDPPKQLALPRGLNIYSPGIPFESATFVKMSEFLDARKIQLTSASGMAERPPHYQWKASLVTHSYSDRWPVNQGIRTTLKKYLDTSPTEVVFCLYSACTG